MSIAAYAALNVAMQIAKRFQAKSGAAATVLAFAGASITFKALIFGLGFAFQAAPCRGRSSPRF